MRLPVTQRLCSCSVHAISFEHGAMMCRIQRSYAMLQRSDIGITALQWRKDIEADSVAGALRDGFESAEQVDHANREAVAFYKTGPSIAQRCPWSHVGPLLTAMRSPRACAAAPRD